MYPSLKNSLIITFFLVLICNHASPARAEVVKILSNTSHYSSYISDTINQLLGGGHIDTDIFVHRTTLTDSGYNGSAATALNSTNTYYETTSSNATNSAPYHIYSTSFTGYTGDSVAVYNEFDGIDLLHNYAFTYNTNSPPPVFYSAPGGTAFGSSAGVEWTIPVNAEINFSVTPSTLSELTARNAGLLASVRYDHPNWNWFDVKGAIRQTASNWTTGYSSTTYGFGNVSYASSTALLDNEILLQPPTARVATTSVAQLQFTLYPFKQTRRAKEVLFQFPNNPGFHATELTLNDITTTLQGVKVTEYIDTKATSTLTPTSNALSNAYFVWFTADNLNDTSAIFSRIDSYSILGPYSQPKINFLNNFTSLSPSNNATTSSRFPTFSWNELWSASGISKYQLYIDGSLHTDNITSTSTTPSSPLNLGSHTWYVVATNNEGATTSSATRTVLITLEQAGNYTYYVDNVRGNDSNEGTASEPFATIGKAASIVMPGNTIRIVHNENNPYRERVSPRNGDIQNGNAIFRAADPTNKPEIWGSVDVSQTTVGDWTIRGDALPNTYQRAMSGVSVFATGQSLHSLQTRNVSSNSELTLNEGEWKTDGINIYYRLRADEDINTLHIEAGQESHGLVCTTRNTFKDLIVKYTNSIGVSLGVGCIGEGLEVYNNGAIGVHMSDSGPGTSNGAILRNSIISNNGSRGLNIESITYGRVQNNTITNNEIGMYVGNWAHYTQICNNIFFDNDTNVDINFITTVLNFTASHNNWDTGEIDSEWINTYKGTNNLESTSPLFSDVSQSNFGLESASPNIDSGLHIGLTTDAFGNPVYGTPDIGAVEYQPPFTIGTNSIRAQSSIKLYLNGQYRYINESSDTTHAHLTLYPEGGFETGNYSEYMDITIHAWNADEENLQKSWTASSTETTGGVFSISQLSSNSSYMILVNGSVSPSVSGSNCVDNICTSDQNGTLTFSYNGSWSSPTFTLTKHVIRTSNTTNSSGGGSKRKNIIKETENVAVPESSSSTEFTKEEKLRQTLLSRIQELRSIIEKLTTKSVPRNSVEKRYKFTTTLRVGDTHEEVLLLQKKLNDLGFVVATSGIGSPGNETNYFGQLTKVAIMKFQCYHSIICSDSPDVLGYGNFGPKTMAKINEL